MEVGVSFYWVREDISFLALNMRIWSYYGWRWPGIDNYRVVILEI